MNNKITISFTPDKIPVDVALTYNIDVADGMHTVHCSVCAPYPQWLQLRKFNIASVIKKNGHELLFDAANADANLATSQFIDSAYDHIMKAEKKAFR